MAVDRIKELDGVTYLQALLGGPLLPCIPDLRVSPHVLLPIVAFVLDSTIMSMLSVI